MEIKISNVLSPDGSSRVERRSFHTAQNRLKPSIFQYDYLSLNALATDVVKLIQEVDPLKNGDAPIALDIGCGTSPYRQHIEKQGFVLRTIDINAKASPDYVGSVEKSGIHDKSMELVICTQVLEHLIDPAQGLREIFRILVPGGYLIASAPHIWFYHPHPSDNWRFTQEGLIRLITSAGFEPKILLSQGGSILSYFQITNFLLFGVLGRFGASVYALNNLAGKLSDGIFRNNLFCINFALLARKPGE